MHSKQWEDRRTLRRQFLEIVARRQRPGAGSMLSALDQRRMFMDWWNEADRVLRDVPHAVGGAVAANAYAPERSTRDIDLIVLVADAERAAALLCDAGWRRIGSLAGIKGSSWKDGDGHDLDLLELVEPWGAEAIGTTQANVIAGMPTLTLPYLTWMKLSAARTVDLADISRMLGRASPEQTGEARGVVARLGIPDDVADFDRLVQMGRLERSRQSSATL